MRRECPVQAIGTPARFEIRLQPAAALASGEPLRKPEPMPALHAFDIQHAQEGLN